MTFWWFLLTVVSALGLLVSAYIAGKQDLKEELERKEEIGEKATIARGTALFFICAIVILAALLGRGC